MIKFVKVDLKFANIGSVETDKFIYIEAYRHYFQLFEIEISVFFGSKNLEKYRSCRDIEQCEAVCTSFLDNTNEIVMAFKDSPSLNTIVHECTHACDFILSFIKYERPDQVDELNAYLTAYLVDIVSDANSDYQAEKTTQ